MMRRASILLAALLLAPVVQQAGAEVSARPVGKCAMISDAAGRAGMVAAYLPPARRADSPMVMMAGGANFPNARFDARTPEERGEKVYYADVFVIVSRELASPDDKFTPVKVGTLPEPVAYAACASSPKGMVVAGGCNARGHVSTVTRTSISGSVVDAIWEDRAENCANTEYLPSLPVTLAYPAYAVVGEVLFVMGGQEKAEDTGCAAGCYSLDLRNPAAGWAEHAKMPSPRMLATAGVVDGKIYVAGGCSLHADAEGKAERTYLDDVWCYDPETDEWTDTGSHAPQTIVGAATPMPSREGKLYLICGDPGDYYRASLKGEAPEDHPGQSTAIYSYTPASGAWEKEGDTPVGVATAPSVEVDGIIYIISGETRPGVRTPIISTLEITK